MILTSLSVWKRTEPARCSHALMSLLQSQELMVSSWTGQIAKELKISFTKSENTLEPVSINNTNIEWTLNVSNSPNSPLVGYINMGKVLYYLLINSCYSSWSSRRSLFVLQLQADEAWVSGMENDALASFMCQNRLFLSVITATYPIFCVVGGPLELFSMRYSPWVGTLRTVCCSSLGIWPQLFKGWLASSIG